MPENVRPEPTYMEMQTAEVEIPKYGDTLPGSVKRLGMTTAKELFGAEKARNPEQKVLVIFAEADADSNVKARTPVTYYSHPSIKSKIAKYVREYGQPAIGQHVTLIRNDDGFWEVKL